MSIIVYRFISQRIILIVVAPCLSVLFGVAPAWAGGRRYTYDMRLHVRVAAAVLI